MIICSIQKEAQRRARVVRDQPETPLERAVYWTEYVIRHRGAHHLRSAAVDMPWYQVELLDVFLFLRFAILSPIIFLFYLVKKCCKKSKKPKME